MAPLIVKPDQIFLIAVPQENITLIVSIYLLHPLSFLSVALGKSHGSKCFTLNRMAAGHSLTYSRALSVHHAARRPRKRMRGLKGRELHVVEWEVMGILIIFPG